MILEHLITPCRCPACDVTTPSLCPGCRAEVRLWRPGACLRCGAARIDGCLCALLPSTLESVRARWVFEGLIADLVEDAKYRGRTWPLMVLRRELAGWLAAVGDLGVPRALWVPVPPSKRRLRRSGFDLAATLAGWGARVTRGRRRLSVLVRQPGGRRQAVLGRAQRLHALEGRFVARRPLRGAEVVLVDDVVTSGATLAACARALADAGAGRVRALALARTPRYAELTT